MSVSVEGGVGTLQPYRDPFKDLKRAGMQTTNIIQVGGADGGGAYWHEFLGDKADDGVYSTKITVSNGEVLEIDTLPFGENTRIAGFLFISKLMGLGSEVEAEIETEKLADKPDFDRLQILLLDSGLVLKNYNGMARGLIERYLREEISYVEFASSYEELGDLEQGVYQAGGELGEEFRKFADFAVQNTVEQIARDESLKAKYGHVYNCIADDISVSEFEASLKSGSIAMGYNHPNRCEVMFSDGERIFVITPYDDETSIYECPEGYIPLNPEYPYSIISR